MDGYKSSRRAYHKDVPANTDSAYSLITVLYVTHSSNLSGANQSLADLIVSVQGKIKPIVLLPSFGPAFDLFSSVGAKCIVSPYALGIRQHLKCRNVISLMLHPLRFPYLNRIRSFFRLSFVLKKELKDEEIKIVHSNTSLTTIGIQLSRLFGSKHVWHVREQIDNQHFNDRFHGQKKRIKHKIEKAQARVVVSNYCMNSWEFKTENTYVLFDAVRWINESLLFEKKQSYFLFCSNYITEAKGCFFVIRAFGLSGLADKGVRLKIVGNDIGLNKSIIALAEEVGCVGSIDILPFQNDINQLFAHSLAFINPSIDEGLGRTTAEAMFFGCPVIGLASGGTIDLIKNEETGYLFSSIEECADLLKRVYGTNQHNIIINAQEFVKKELSIDYYGEKILKVYHGVLEDKNKGV